jgi:hypothetical protein
MEAWKQDEEAENPTFHHSNIPGALPDTLWRCYRV